MRRFNQDTFEDQSEPLDLDDPLSILLAVESVTFRLTPILKLELQTMPKKSIALDNLADLEQVVTTDPRITALTTARDDADIKLTELKAKLVDVAHNRRLAEEALNKAKEKLALVTTPANAESVDKLATIFVEERSVETKLEADIAGLQEARRSAVIQLNRLVVEEKADAAQIVLPDAFTPIMQMRMLSAIAQMCQYQFAAIQYGESMARAYEVVRGGATFPEFERKDQENRDEASIRREAQLNEFGIARRAAELAFMQAKEQLTDNELDSPYLPTLYWKSDAQVLRDQYDRKGKQALERAQAVQALASKQREGVSLEHAHLMSNMASRV